MKDKKDNNIVIISAIISLIIGISFLIYFLNYYNIKLTTIISIVIAILIIIPLLYIPYRIAEKKTQLIDELFIIDISSKLDNNEHIRITEKNILFKYKSIIKYYYIFPKLFSSLSLNGKSWETLTYNIIAKSQLSIDELNDILKKINDLNNNADGDIIINYKGNKKFANKNDIDKIFKNYFVQN